MVIKAALLDAPASSGKGRFVRIDTLADKSQLTANHVPSVTACDLEGGRYVWEPSKNTFIDERALNAANAPSMESALLGLCNAVQTSGLALPPETVAWMDGVRK